MGRLNKSTPRPSGLVFGAGRLLDFYAKQSTRMGTLEYNIREAVCEDGKILMVSENNHGRCSRAWKDVRRAELRCGLELPW
uniref:Uncharacterized protein n=1 Tax=Vespula pensylvanica TaxID=30213 RepID=A0A834P8R4_VESPE|nr:hypothetical protein H0235_005217 [Vespula pensylvanica]